MDATIYGLTDPDGATIRYVGSTTIDAGARAVQHYRLRRQTAEDGNIPFALWLGEHGVPNVITLAKVPVSRQWEAERDWSRKLRAEGHPLLNVKDGYCWPVTAEWRERHSRRLRARFYRHSQATRARMSTAIRAAHARRKAAA